MNEFNAVRNSGVSVLMNTYNDAAIACMLRGESDPEHVLVPTVVIDEYNTERLRDVIGDFSEDDEYWEDYVYQKMTAAGWALETEIGGRWDGQSFYEKEILADEDVNTINTASKEALFKAAENVYVVLHLKDPAAELINSDVFNRDGDVSLSGDRKQYVLSGFLDQFHDAVIRLGVNITLDEYAKNIESAISSLYPVTWERLNALL